MACQLVNFGFMSLIFQVGYAIDGAIKRSGFPCTKSNPNKGLNPTVYTMTGTEEAIKKKGVREMYTVCLRLSAIYLVVTRYDIPAGKVVNSAGKIIREAERVKMFTIVLSAPAPFIKLVSVGLPRILNDNDLGRFIVNLNTSAKKIELVVREDDFEFVQILVDAFFAASPQKGVVCAAD